MRVDTTDDRILGETEGAIGWVTINNPARRNAMSLEMWEAMADLIDRFAKDDAIRVVVMKGAGDKAFMSGADISQFEKVRHDANSAAHYKAVSEGARSRLAHLEKPLIAMIRGFCLGGGLGVALTADFRVASTDSQFGIPAAKMNIVYAFEGVKTLTALVGPGMAKQILFTAKRYTAEEAHKMGLIEDVTTPEALEATVRAYATTIAENAPMSIRATKLTVRQIFTDETERDLEALVRLGQQASDSADFAEGRRAFMEKRKPVFKGR